MREQERRKTKELVAKYNQYYCQPGEDIAKLGLSLERIDVKFEPQTLVFLFKLSNLNSEQVFSHKARVCGEVVSKEINLSMSAIQGIIKRAFQCQ